MTAKPKTKAKPKKKTKAGSGKKSAHEKALIFANAYIANGQNATQAAITAGYAEKSAGVTGNKLLKHTNVLAIITKANEKAATLSGLTVERTLQEIARLAYSDPRKLFNPDGTLKQIHELDDDTAACIASVEMEEIKAGGAVIGMTRKVKQWDKNAALEKAMKFHGLYEKDNEQQNKPIINITANMTQQEAILVYEEMIGVK